MEADELFIIETYRTPTFAALITIIDVVHITFAYDPY